ncbi:MAG: hypothetical protein H6842_11310 [Rhodospirillaceae bacterium]|nr:hypothetical protein [Rhodospirillaceae bacterium]
MGKRLQMRAAAVVVVAACILDAAVAGAQCPEQWAILRGSQVVGPTAQPLPPQTIATTWFMRQTGGGGPYGTWRLVRQVTEFSFQTPLPMVPPSGPTTLPIGDQVHPCLMSYTATSAGIDCESGIDYQVTQQGIFAPGGIHAGQVQNGQLQIETVPADVGLATAPGQPTPGAMTMVGRPGALANQVRIDLAANRNSAQAPSAFRVFFTVRIDPAALLDHVTLTYDFPGAALTQYGVSADGLSRTAVYSLPGTSRLTDAMLDHAVKAELVLDTCRYTVTARLRDIL